MIEEHAETVEVDLVAPAEMDDVQVSAWRDLAAGAAEPNPFFDPGLLLAAVRWLPGGDRVRLLRVFCNERLVLAMPITRERYRRVPMAAQSTWRHPYCYLGTPLVRPEALDVAPAAALRKLRRAGPSWLVLEQVYVHGPVTRAFRRAAEHCAAGWTEYGAWERPAVLGSEHSSQPAPPSSRSLHRLRRKLERAIGPVEIREVARVADPLALDAEIEAYLELELASWKGRVGTAIASSTDHAAFFRDTCRAFAADGRLDLWRLQAGPFTAARECHLRTGDTLFQWKTAYDEHFARYSPGAQIELDLLQAFYDDPELRSLDPCTGNVMKPLDRLYPDRRLIGDVLVGLTPPGVAITRMYPRAARAWSRARSVWKRGDAVSP